jgi:leucyl-tRNA synthetase
MEPYNHKAIEEKWQRQWKDSNAFAASDDSTKPKKYILDMYPYPSGAGLHVGHVEGYTATDIYSRYLRMRGFEVLHPMGWDAFGLPAENYAVKTGIPPAQTTEEAIKTFTAQINSLGLSYDWAREVGTHRPEYYKWTQWLFQLLYKNDLAYKQKAKVNWCPKDQTVLANEQVVNGACERCGTQVIQKDLEQWFFRITKYAEALLSDLEQIDWPESTKAAQRNWIGKSEGSEITFTIEFEGGQQPGKIPVFTTRADTLFGATFLTLAPEHPWVTLAIDDNHIGVLKNRDEVIAYVEATAKKTELERQNNKEKTGVKLEGVWAVNPANSEQIPIFVADYALGHYGTGAVMGVPAHDERDYAFAQKFSVPVIGVIDSEPFPYTEEGVLVNSGEFNGLVSAEAKKKITEAVGGVMKTTYRLRDWLISRQRYWGAPIPMVYDPEGKLHMVPEEHLPWLLPTDVEFMPTGESPIAHSKELKERVEKIFGPGWRPEVDTMDTFMCSSWYFFRFADPHNDQEFASKEKMAHWLPVDTYVGGAEHTVLHLLYARFFTKVLHDLGYIDFTEPFSALRHPGTILAEDGRKMSKSLGNVVNPNDVVAQYGADAVRLYEMFMGPFSVAKPWNTNNILGVRRFIERVWGAQALVVADDVQALDVVLHQTVQKVSDDIVDFKFNTVVSQLMILLNAYEKEGAVGVRQFRTLIQLLAPLAPHVAEELWSLQGGEGSVHASTWPVADGTKMVAETVTIGVQVNGKVRGTVTLAREIEESAALDMARQDPGVAKWLSEGRETGARYVPGRIISFVVEKLDPLK